MQIAVVFAKIARVDYPQHWPTLIDDLLAALTGSDALKRRRGYLVLHHVLKELSSKRLAADQRNFAQARANNPLHINCCTVSLLCRCPAQ